MTRPATNWPAFWGGFWEGWYCAAIFAALILWLAVLPTVGVLYFLGALA